MSNILKAIVIYIIIVYCFSIIRVLPKKNTELEQHNFNEYRSGSQHFRRILNLPVGKNKGKRRGKSIFN